MNLPQPKSQIQKILLDLITQNKGVTESDYRYHMFRGYISMLRRKIRVKHIDKTFKNTFGRKGSYRIHFLTNTERVKAIRIYKQLTKRSSVV